MSKGTDRVNLGFNPSNNGDVVSLKKMTADIIDFVEVLRTNPAEAYSEADVEVQRLLSLAQTAYEEACMWAVKAATYGR